MDADRASVAVSVAAGLMWCPLVTSGADRARVSVCVRVCEVDRTAATSDSERANTCCADTPSDTERFVASLCEGGR